MKRRQDDYLRNCRQINFVVLNGFCLLSKPPPDLLFLFVICFYISRYHFSRILRTSFNNIWIKYFRHKFSFFNGFTQPPFHPLNSQNPLCVTKIFCRCSLNARIWRISFKTSWWFKASTWERCFGYCRFWCNEGIFHNRLTRIDTSSSIIRKRDANRAI